MLQRSAGYFRSEVGKRLGIRYTPSITFAEDTSLDYGMKIDQLLRDVDKKE